MRIALWIAGLPAATAWTLHAFNGLLNEALQFNVTYVTTAGGSETVAFGAKGRGSRVPVAAGDGVSATYDIDYDAHDVESWSVAYRLMSSGTVCETPVGGGGWPSLALYFGSSSGISDGTCEGLSVTSVPREDTPACTVTTVWGGRVGDKPTGRQFNVCYKSPDLKHDAILTAGPLESPPTPRRFFSPRPSPEAGPRPGTARR